MKTLRRTGVYTFSTADALRRTGNFRYGKRRRACFFTCLAGYTPFLFPVNLHQTELIKKAVDGAERTQILAKRPKTLDGKYDDEKQHAKLPVKQSAKLSPQRFIHAKQRYRSKQRARRA